MASQLNDELAAQLRKPTYIHMSPSPNGKRRLIVRNYFDSMGHLVGVARLEDTGRRQIRADIPE